MSDNKPQILLVGEHPASMSGNGHMLCEILRQIDYNKYNVAVFSATRGITIDPFTSKYPFNIIEGGNGDEDGFGINSLVYTLHNLPNLNVVIFVGLDCWRYSAAIKEIMKLRELRKFRWVSIFPYDLISLREDWISWIAPIDIPCVYSQYGYNMLKGRISQLQYFRPPLFDAEYFVSYPQDIRKKKQKEIFKILFDDSFVFGFFGINMIRKDPQRLIKAFYEVKKEFPHTHLYLHTELSGGNYNLEQYMKDCGRVLGDSFTKKQGVFTDSNGMCSSYNIVDSMVTCSLQEGLNWTILEAMLCGTPIIASDTTAHKELVEGVGILVPCTDLAYLPIETGGGPSWVETRACDLNYLVNAMKQTIKESPDLREKRRELGISKAKEWLSGVSNINDVIAEACKTKVSFTKKTPAVLFAQHSSAGDVLMSTQCLKPLKKRHKGMKLIYMTQRQFQDIVTNNPNIDEIIDWDENLLKSYQIVYNPHGERILPGGFNNLDATLYSMYPYFCRVEADEMFIECKKPNVNLPKEFVIVHTTGGDVTYRTYAHMDVAAKEIRKKYPIIQVGGTLDLKCENIDLDLRGSLSFRETAYIMTKALAAVVIDSFPSHLAGHLKTPVVVLYGPAPARVTQPRGDSNLIINLEPNRLDVCENLTTCWGASGKNPCDKPCINTINPHLIVKKIYELLDRLTAVSK